jgi:hypothetical protein
MTADRYHQKTSDPNGDYFTRYLAKVGGVRAQAAIAKVETFATEMAAVEHQILAAANGATDVELQRLMAGAVAEAQEKPVTWWDLLRSEQVTRLALLKLAMDLRAMILGITLLVGGIGIGLLVAYSIWGRSPPPAPTCQSSSSTRTIQS